MGCSQYTRGHRVDAPEVLVSIPFTRMVSISPCHIGVCVIPVEDMAMSYWYNTWGGYTYGQKLWGTGNPRELATVEMSVHELPVAEFPRTLEVETTVGDGLVGAAVWGSLDPQGSCHSRLWAGWCLISRGLASAPQGCAGDQGKKAAWLWPACPTAVLSGPPVEIPHFSCALRVRLGLET